MSNRAASPGFSKSLWTGRRIWESDAFAYGATDKDGTEATEKKVGILDLYGTLYKGLGIDPTPETNASVRDNLGRPYYIAGDKATEKAPQKFLSDSLWIPELVG